MKVGLGILTYNRPQALYRMLEGVINYCYNSLDYIRIIDDGSSEENNAKNLENIRRFSREKIVYASTKINKGVAAMSNILIRQLFNLDCDYLIIANDDLVIKDNPIPYYIEACEKTGIQMFCFRKWKGSHRDKVTNFTSQGIDFTVLHRITGHWMFMTKEIVKTIGYFDTGYGKFGEEHVDYVIRANASGALGKDLSIPYTASIDIKDSIKYLDYQDVPSAIIDQNELSYWSNYASAYHHKKWNSVAKVNIYELYS